MLVEFLSTVFFIFNILLIILIVMQKNHGGFWSGPAGNDSVNVFGGNQGADVLQKATWIFGAILIFGCLSLSVYQSAQSQISQFYLSEVKTHIIDEQKTNNADTIKDNEEKNEDENIEITTKDEGIKTKDIEIRESKKEIQNTPHVEKKKEITKKSIASNTRKK